MLLCQSNCKKETKFKKLNCFTTKCIKHYSCVSYNIIPRTVTVRQKPLMVAGITFRVANGRSELT